MIDPTKKTKISLIISIFSVIISLVAVIISLINIRYSIANGKATGLDITLFCCTMTVLFANITILISSNNAHKNSSK